MFARPYALMMYAPDMKASVAFYQEKLGFQVRFQEEGWSELVLGGQAIALHGTDKKVLERTDTYPHLILEVADIEKALGELKEKSVAVHTEVEEIGGGCGWCAAVLDPAGNMVGLYQAAPHGA